MGFKAAVIIVFCAVFLYGLALKIISRRSRNNPIPGNVADVYDRETYLRWRAYRQEKNSLAIVESAVGFAVELALLAFNAYAAFAGLFPKSLFPQMFAVLLLSALASVAHIPFDYRDTMGIEEKYGFNRSTAATFWLDHLKEFLIGVALMTAVGWVLMAVHRALGDWMILAFALAMTALALIISFLFPILSRVFNKFTPLEDGQLKDTLTALLEKHGYRVRAIEVMDASRRSSKSNAYFTGFGKMKTIVLYDTLVKAMTPEEILAVFAHEMGHGLHRDTLKNQLLSFLQMGVLGVLAYFTLRYDGAFLPFGFDGVNYGFALILILSVEFALLQPLFGLFTNWLSRRAEYRADAQAVAEGYGAALVSALKTLARENFADLNPDPLLVRLEYSHPTLSQRIQAIESGAKAKANP